jgi:hypothetical protein
LVVRIARGTSPSVLRGAVLAPCQYRSTSPPCAAFGDSAKSGRCPGVWGWIAP